VDILLGEEELRRRKGVFLLLSLTQQFGNNSFDVEE
jgi:hypothetical protein